MGCRGYIIQGLDPHRYSILPPLARPRLECNLPNITHYYICTFAAPYVVSIAPALLSLYSTRYALFTVCSWLLVIPTDALCGTEVAGARPAKVQIGKAVNKQHEIGGAMGIAA